jgi:AcrR family transcriptional regulator
MTLSVEAVAPRARDRNRAEMILAAARTLFRERGYHAVLIDDIGTAAGITGPGIYRHFAAKEELLVAALDGAAEQMWRNVSEEHGQLTIEDYVRSHIEWAVQHADLIALWYQEWRNLPDADQLRQRRLQRRYVERWVDTLLDERPELSDTEARVMVRGVIGIIHSVSHTEPILDPDRVREVLATMSLNALRP